MSDITAIKRELMSQVKAVCEHLLPAGKLIRQEWEAGSIGGEVGKSLKVNIQKGVWSDFQTGEGGDLIDLWREVKGLTLREAFVEIRDYLGIEVPHFHKIKKEWNRPKSPQCTTPKSQVLAYLTEDRNVPAEILSRYKIGEQGANIVFPFLRDGVLILAKTREAVNGAKPKPTEANCEKILFGWQAIPDDARKVYITEGEIDALSLAAYGFPALSVPFGGGSGNKQDWLENEYDRLTIYEEIYLCLDDDGPGKEGAQEIARRLGHRCRIAKLPRKDANQCLVDGIPQSQIEGAIANAETLDPETLGVYTDYTENVVSLLWPDGDRPVGYSVPYAKFKDKIFFRPGEVTVWTGQTGAGKSQLLSDCSVDWMKQGSKLCIASLEMSPPQLIKRMVKQSTNTDRPTIEIINEAIGWFYEHGVLYTKVGKAGIESMLSAFEYAMGKWGCDQFVIDSLMRLGIAGDDYNGQEATMYQIVDWTIQNNVHTHFVCHNRKASADRPGPQGSEGIKGGMEIGANAFNIIEIWRDPKFEEAKDKRDNGVTLDEKEEKLLEIGGVVFNCSKQRNGDWTGKGRLHFNLETYQYRSTSATATGDSTSS